jgi:hypothetical protein
MTGRWYDRVDVCSLEEKLNQQKYPQINFFI